VTVADTASTRDRLLQVATQLFAERGYSGTSMADIAEGVGVRKASLYNYFPSKEDLLLELLEQCIEAWKEASRPALEVPGSFERRLWNHLKAVVEFTAHHRHKVAIVRLAATQIGGELGLRVRRLLTATANEYLERMRDFFAGAMTAGEVEPRDPWDLTLSWRAFMDGLLINQIFRFPNQNPYEDRLERIWRLIWRGLSGRLPEESAPE
jgi:AcrR family transcriptional regulator